MKVSILNIKRKTVIALILVFSITFMLNPIPNVSADSSIPTVYGVNEHPERYPDWKNLCDKIIDSGIKWIRISPEWSDIETLKGVYNTDYLAKTDNIVDYLTQHGVNILWVLCYTAPWASSVPDTPEVTRYKPANWQDWSDYVLFITNRYKGKINNWEVWNEPDLPEFWKNSINDYYILLGKAHKAIKAVNPNNNVLVGGIGLGNNAVNSYGIGTFFDTLLSYGAASYFDVINYHSYGALSEHASKYNGMIDVINKYSITNKKIWVTETGLTSSGVASEEINKADYVDRIYEFYSKHPDIEKVFWYCFRNTSTDDPVEDNYGLVSKDLVPLDAYNHFKILVKSKKTFNDLDNYEWARKPIEYLASRGIINGTSETTYEPGAQITRADFTRLLVKALGLSAIIDSTFEDVNPDNYYYNEVGIAKKLGITSGKGNNLFVPNAPITREEIMTLTARALKIAGKLKASGTIVDLSKFIDKSSVSPYAVDSVALLIKEGIITGSDNRLNPGDNATRAETAMLIYKIRVYQK